MVKSNVDFGYVTAQDPSIFCCLEQKKSSQIEIRAHHISTPLN